MTDTTSCAHHQFFGAREFCPDCGLSRTEVLVEACAPFLKDGETPAECIARNRRDVDGCLTMLIAERRKVEALRSRLAEVKEELAQWHEVKEELAQWQATGESVTRNEHDLAARLAEVERDAARYRWLRDSAGNDIMEKLMAECSPPRWDELVDAAIDAAMGERP